MSWASTRRTLILTSIFGVIAVLLAVVLIATLYETPSCNDGKKNQDESGVDCGAACEKVCTVGTLPPVVQFVRDVPGPGGRVDVIAYVENKNGDSAARDISYTIELFGESHEVLATKTGTVDLPPSSEVPLYIQNVYAGGQSVSEVFMTFDENANSWFRYVDTRPVVRIEDVQTTGTEREPKVTSVVKNGTAYPLKNVRVVATVFNEENNAIAASQTILGVLPAEGSAVATFTWSAPFIGTAARIDVRSVLSLP